MSVSRSSEKFASMSISWRRVGFPVVLLLLIGVAGVFFGFLLRYQPFISTPEVHSANGRGYEAPAGDKSHGLKGNVLNTSTESSNPVSGAFVQNQSPTMQAVGTLYTADQAIEVIQKLEGQFGVGVPEIERAKFTIGTICKSLPQRTNILLYNPSVSDPSREWAAGILLRYCDGWDIATDPGKYFKTGESVGSRLRNSDKDAAIAYAADVLSAQNLSYELYEAAQFLNEQGKVPTPEQMGLPRGEFGPTDQAEAMFIAVDVLECTLANACGPNSIVALNYCLANGCTPRSGYLDAISQNVSPGEYQLIMAYAQWLLAQRQRGRG